MNPPSAWAVAKRDAPQVAKQLWTFDLAGWPQGPLRPVPALFLGHLELLGQQARRQEPAALFCRRPQVEQLVAAGQGYDLPAFANLHDFETWPMRGRRRALYNYPPREDLIASISCAPAPTNIATQMYSQATMTKMIARCTQQGQSIDQAIAWASDEIEGFMRG